MKTKRLPATDESVVPDLDPLPDALLDGSESLETDAAAATDGYLRSNLFQQSEICFVNLPVYYQLRERPYHRFDLQGPFDMRRLARDYRQHIYRSEVHCLQKSKPAIERLVLCLGQGVFVLYDGVDLNVFAPTPQVAAQVAAGFRRYVQPRKRAKPGFYLVSLASNGPNTELVEIDACPKAETQELALHYGADFVTWETQWLARLSQRHSGVTILSGPPGVGKTSYLKMLMARFLDRFVFYYLPLSSFELLTTPHCVGFWLEQNRQHHPKAKVAIIEDAENLLLPRDERSRAQVSNLLNIGDGFLGEHLKLHVVATTNAPMRRMDEAMLRPGRLMGTREFRRLTRAEALRLAQAKGLKLADGSDSWSLAEIYNGKAEVLTPEPSVGFSPGTTQTDQ